MEVSNEGQSKRGLASASPETRKRVARQGGIARHKKNTGS